MDNKKVDFSDEALEKVTGGENLPPEHFGLKYCPYCSELYPIGSKHRCIVHTCPYCSESFNNLALYEIHLDTVHGVGPLSY